MNLVTIYDGVDLLKDRDKFFLRKTVCSLARQCWPLNRNTDFRHDIGLFLLLSSYMKEDSQKVKESMACLRYNELMMPNAPKCYSVSYSNNTICCAVSENIVGIDIQSYKEIDFDIIDEYLSIEERKKILRQENIIVSATKLFALKECFGKFLGVGLGYDFMHTDFNCLENQFEKYGADFEVLMLEKGVMALCSLKGMKFKYEIITYNDLMENLKMVQYI